MQSYSESFAPESLRLIVLAKQNANCRIPLSEIIDVEAD
jgi:hypothetical protein